MGNSRTALQKSLVFEKLPTAAPRLVPVVLEPKGVVYTKAWVVELLLDLAEYRSDNNLVDAVAIEPAAGDGAFLGPMIERLIASCRKFGRPLSDCRGSLVLGLDQPLEFLGEGLARAASQSACAGFAIGRSVFMDAARVWFAGEMSDAAAVAEIAKRFEAVVQIWREAREATLRLAIEAAR